MTCKLAPAAERGQRVATHIVTITSPPDARYAPLRAPPAAAQRTFSGVRALVLPVAGAQAIAQVRL